MIDYMEREIPNIVDNEEVEKILAWICWFCAFVLFCCVLSLDTDCLFWKANTVIFYFLTVFWLLLEMELGKAWIWYLLTVIFPNPLFFNMGANVLDLLLLRDDWWNPCCELLACSQQSLLEVFSQFSYWCTNIELSNSGSRSLLSCVLCEISCRGIYVIIGWICS